MNNITNEERKRFDSRWIKKGQCYLWQGFLDKDGYGSFYFRKKLRRAHRVSYFMTFGSIPQGMVIDHICGKRNCVFPHHLRILTIKENNLDSRNIGAINSKRIYCLKGHLFDRKYGKQRYCSICQSEKSKRLRKKWSTVANKILC